MSEPSTHRSGRSASPRATSMRKLLASGATLVTLGMAALSVSTVQAPTAQATAPSSAYAVIGTIPLGATPQDLAIDTDDDTVYVISNIGGSVITIPPGATSGAPAATVSLPGGPASIAVDSDDDTVYVRDDGSYDGRLTWAMLRGERVDGEIRAPDGITSIAVNGPDDTVYLSYGYNTNDDSVLAVNGARYDDSLIFGGVGAPTLSMAVDQADDTIWLTGNPSSLYMAQAASRAITPMAGTYVAPRDLAVSSVTHAAYLSSRTIPYPTAIRVTPDGSRTPWVSPASGLIRGMSVDDSGTRVVITMANGTINFLDGITMQQDAEPITWNGATRVAQASSGLIYVTGVFSGSLAVIAKVQGGITGGSVQPGDAVDVGLTTTPEYAAGQQVDMAASTVTSITFGGYPATYTKTGIGVFTAQAPSGPTGPVEVVANLAGGGSISLGSVTYPSPAPPPRPIPIFPSSPPQDVVATAGDASASVTWSAPEWPGTFPITEYAVTASPSGRMCLTTTTTCTVDGLDNGMTYAFTVKALTGAGWSQESAPSNAVTPKPKVVPSIVINGTREGRRIAITGMTTGLQVGSALIPEVTREGRGAVSGRAVDVRADGTIRWSRVASPRAGWTVGFTAVDGTRSNIVRIDSR